MSTFRIHDDVAAVRYDEAGNPNEGRAVFYGTVTEVKPLSVAARFSSMTTRLFLLDSRDQAWCDGGKYRLVPVCCCDNPITGTPVVAEDDPLGRQYCSGECLDGAAEAAHEQHYRPGVAT